MSCLLLGWLHPQKFQLKNYVLKSQGQVRLNILADTWNIVSRNPVSIKYTQDQCQAQGEKGEQMTCLFILLSHNEKEKVLKRAKILPVSKVIFGI